jgi:nickel-dependent lactate racemase
MRVEVTFQDEQLDFEVPEDRLLGEWRGPASLTSSQVEHAIRSALEEPLDYPPLRQTVVPGDRVVIPCDAGLPDASRILDTVYTVLKGAGVEAEAVQVLTTTAPGPGMSGGLGPEVRITRHDPQERETLAYLATTSKGHRVYLNRLLTDADFVLPIGRLRYDPVLGYQGPWSLIYPSLSNVETIRLFGAVAVERPSVRDAESPSLSESAEVSWLLGSQFYIGVVEGLGGVSSIMAGRDERVRREGIAAVDASWSLRAEDRADLVVAGIGRPEQTSNLDDIVRGLDTAMRLVRRGGKIVALSRAGGPLGPAVQRLRGADDPRSGPGVLRGSENEPDYATARRLASVLAWADVFLLSALDEQEVEGLSMIALGKPSEARRLVAGAASSIYVSSADRTRAEVAGESV